MTDDENERELAELVGPCVLLSRVSDRTAHVIPQALAEDGAALQSWLESSSDHGRASDY